MLVLIFQKCNKPVCLIRAEYEILKEIIETRLEVLFTALNRIEMSFPPVPSMGTDGESLPSSVPSMVTELGTGGNFSSHPFHGVGTGD